MKLLQEFHSEGISNLMLYGAIMLANIDYMGIMDYIIKAVAGGVIWCGFKLLQDHYSVIVRNRAKALTKDPENNQEDKK